MSRNLFGAELFFDPSYKPSARRETERPRSRTHRAWSAPESEKVEPFTVCPPDRSMRPPLRLVQS